jgi:hypothetical protein
LKKNLSSFLKNRITDLTAELDIPTSVDKYVKSGDITIKYWKREENGLG